MLKMGLTSVSATSEINEITIAFFNASFERSGGYSVSKSIVSTSLYNENKDACDADYVLFEKKAAEMAERI